MSHLRPILIAAFLGAVTVTASAETTRTSQIYLQRGADGRSILTDRPSANAVTERTWQMDREDPVAARERALEVQRQAEAVSARVQRSIEAQQRLASEENFMRLRMAQQSAPSGIDDDEPVIFAPLGFGPLGNRFGDRFDHRSDHGFDHRRPPHRPHGPPGRRPFMRSALPGSR